MRFWPQREPGQDVGLANKRAVKIFLIGLAAISIGTAITFLVLEAC